MIQDTPEITVNQMIAKDENTTIVPSSDLKYNWNTIELFARIYDNDESLLDSFILLETKNQYSINLDTGKIDFNLPLIFSNYDSGNFNLNVEFRSITKYSDFSLIKISPNKKELLLKINEDSNIDFEQLNKHIEKKDSIFKININDEIYNIIFSKSGNIYKGIRADYILIKLDTKINNNINEDDLNINITIYESPYENININDIKVYIKKDKSQNWIQLTGRYQEDENYSQVDETTETSTLDNISSSLTLYNQLENIIDVIFKKEYVKNLAIDWDSWSNHVFFGKAKNKHQLAYNKIKYIQDLNAFIPISGSGSVIDNITTQYKDKIKDVIDSFTSFEYAVYYNTSGSYCWPKDDDGLCLNYSSASIDTWNDIQLSSSIDYDRENRFSLDKTLPERIYNETSTQELLFPILSIWGYFFDEIKMYIENIKYFYTFDFDNINRFPGELFYALGEIFGWKIYEGFDLENLSTYLLTISSNNYESVQSITQEKWYRLFHSISYLNKIKGTRRSIETILNMYGIPSSIITINEYGGTSATNTSIVSNDMSLYVLGFSGSNYLLYNNVNEEMNNTNGWTVEIGTNVSSSIESASLFGNSDFKLLIERSGSNSIYGKAIFATGSTAIVSSSYVPMFNTEFQNITIQYNPFDSGNSGSLNLYTLEYSDNDLKYFDSSSYSWELGAVGEPNINSFWGANNVYFGWDGGVATNKFEGQLREIKLWNTGSISKDEIKVHTYNYESIALNDITNIENVLIGHFKLSDNTTLSTETELYNSAILFTSAALAYGWTDENGFINIKSNQAHLYENIFMPEGLNDNKIEIGFNSSSQYSNIEKTVDVLFDPVRVINNDIINDLLYLDFNDLFYANNIDYVSKYPNLLSWRDFYFNRFPNNKNINTYIRYIRNFDKSFFKIIKQVVPYSVNLNIGILIKPHILNRPKHAWKRMDIINRNLNDTIAVFSNVTQSATLDYTKTSSLQLSDYMETIGLIDNNKYGTINMSLDRSGLYSNFTGSLSLDLYAGNDGGGLNSTIYSSTNRVLSRPYKGTTNTSERDLNATPVTSSESSGAVIYVKGDTERAITIE